MNSHVLDNKDAVNIAVKYLKQILDVKDILLEEIEQTEDGKYWLITLSHEDLSKGKIKKPLSEILRNPSSRSYKVIKINKKSGSVKSMKIRVF